MSPAWTPEVLSVFGIGRFNRSRSDSRACNITSVLSLSANLFSRLLSSLMFFINCCACSSTWARRHVWIPMSYTLLMVYFPSSASRMYFLVQICCHITSGRSTQSVKPSRINPMHPSSSWPSCSMALTSSSISDMNSR